MHLRSGFIYPRHAGHARFRLGGPHDEDQRDVHAWTPAGLGQRLVRLPLSAWEFVAGVSLIVFCAGLVNGVVGLGFVILSAVALALVVDPKDAIILLSIAAPVLSLRQVLRYRSQRAVLRELRPVLAWGTVGVVIGTRIFVALPTYGLALLLGGITARFAYSTLSGRREAPHIARPRKGAAPFVGILGGISSGAIGGAGPVFAGYLSSAGFGRAQLVFGVATVTCLLGGSRLVALLAQAQHDLSTITLGLLLCVPALIGQRIGFWLHDRLPHRPFEIALGSMLVLASIRLLADGASAAWAAMGG